MAVAIILIGVVPARSQNQAAGPKQFWIRDILRSGHTLRYRRYTIEERLRKASCDWPTKEPCAIDVSYAILKRNHRTIAKFDDNVYFEAGNAISFGITSILGDHSRQAIISQDIFRRGTQWIVSLSGTPRIVFNGGRWAVGREVDDVKLIDLDDDGIYELMIPVTMFYGFESLSPAATPLPAIVLKYSKRYKRFLPANPRFADYLLRGIEDRKQNIHTTGGPPDDMNHLSDVLSVVLDYVFAGRRREAWTFYDLAYKLPNKVEIKRKVRAELKRSPVYRFIYRKRISKRA